MQDVRYQNILRRKKKSVCLREYINMSTSPTQPVDRTLKSLEKCRAISKSKRSQCQNIPFRGGGKDFPFCRLHETPGSRSLGVVDEPPTQASLIILKHSQNSYSPLSRERRTLRRILIYTRHLYRSQRAPKLRTLLNPLLNFRLNSRIAIIPNPTPVPTRVPNSMISNSTPGKS